MTGNILSNHKLNNNKDGEFKISLSINDIDKIHDEINCVKNNSEKNPDDAETGAQLTEKQKDPHVINGITLLNTCATCNNKFKPVKSMIDESSCVLCSKKK